MQAQFDEVNVAHFHSLQVTEVQSDTPHAVVVTLAKPDDTDTFDFTQGQYLTLRRDFDGEELRRSYSICAGTDEGVLRVGIKQVEGGAFSTWANEELQAGDTIDVMPPMGRFYTPLDETNRKHYLAFAAGSGITPVLSIIKTTLAAEPQSRVTLVYANRQMNSIMFREELEDLKNIHLGRFSLIHILSAEGQDIDLFSGRIDEPKLEQLFCHWVDADSVDAAFICGPRDMMLTIADVLKKKGIDEKAIKFELFASAQPGRARKPAVSRHKASATDTCSVEVTLDGTVRQFDMPKDGTVVLDAALDNAMDAPFSCKAGVCSTCRGRVLEGEVEMMTNHALEDYEVRAGYVLTCQCLPVSDKVVVSYDE